MTDQENQDAPAEILRSLRAVSVGSFLLQLGVTERLGLHPTDLHAIHLLGGSPKGLSAGELGAGLSLTSGSTTAVIDRLSRKGFISRTRDAIDGRRVIVRLAPAATAALREEYRSIDARVDAAIARLSHAEQLSVARFLAAIADHGSAP